jgi:hypothetical protein
MHFSILLLFTPQNKGWTNPATHTKHNKELINATLIITIPRITEAPGIMKSCNPMANRTLKATPRLNRRVTRNNTLGIMPIPPVVLIVPQLAVIQTYPQFRQEQVHVSSHDMPSMYSPNPRLKNARTYLRHTFCLKPPLQGRQFDQSILHAPWYTPSPARQYQVTKN